MFQVTEKATEMIKNFLQDKGDDIAIRLVLHAGG